MRFANPQYLYLLTILPLLIIFFIWSEKRRKKDLQKIAKGSLLEKLTANYRPLENKLRGVLLTLGVTLILIAIIGPQWGFRWETLTHRGIDVIIAVDTSKSMLAEDLRPSRLERSKLAIQDLVGQLEGDRVGLITFAGTSFLQIPLTIDYNAFMQGIQALSPEIMPQGGTAIGQALDLALKAFQNVEATNKVLLLFTDGENHLGDPIAISKKAKEAEVQVVIIGMGTNTGELIPIVENGHRQFLKDENGNVVKTSLDEKLLKEMAEAASGVYIVGTDSANLDRLYEQFIGKLKKNEINTTRKKNFHERYQIFLLLGIIFITAEMFIGVRKGVKV